MDWRISSFFLTLISVQCILVFGRVGKRVRLHLLQTARKTHTKLKYILNSCIERQDQMIPLHNNNNLTMIFFFLNSIQVFWLGQDAFYHFVFTFNLQDLRQVFFERGSGS